MDALLLNVDLNIPIWCVAALSGEARASRSTALRSDWRLSGSVVSIARSDE